MNDEPRNKRSKLGRREEVDFKHRHWVGTDGPVPDLVNAKFGKLPSNTLPQCPGIFALFRIILPCAVSSFSVLFSFSEVLVQVHASRAINHDHIRVPPS